MLRHCQPRFFRVSRFSRIWQCMSEYSLERMSPAQGWSATTTYSVFVYLHSMVARRILALKRGRHWNLVRYHSDKTPGWSLYGGCSRTKRASHDKENQALSSICWVKHSNKPRSSKQELHNCWLWFWRFNMFCQSLWVPCLFVSCASHDWDPWQNPGSVECLASSLKDLYMPGSAKNI